MSATSAIEWTDATWNPVTGCTKVTPGCDNCYAETFAERWRGTAGHHFETGFDLTLRPNALTMPLRWRKPRRVFVNSMSDLFHKDVPDSFIARVWAVMALTPQHTYQILTKRHGRMRSFFTSAPEPDAGWLPGSKAIWLIRDALEEFPQEHPSLALTEQQWALCQRPIDQLTLPLPNVWLGCSVEDQQRADLRIPALLATPAAVRFLSCEPLLGPIDLTRIEASSRQQPHMVYDAVGQHYDVPGRWQAPTSTRIDWVIVGGESGPGARPATLDWFRTLRDQCTQADVPFFFKQHGEYRGFLATEQETHRAPDLHVNRATGQALREDLVPDTGQWSGVWRLGKKTAGRILDGRTWDQYPQPVATDADGSAP